MRVCKLAEKKKVRVKDQETAYNESKLLCVKFFYVTESEFSPQHFDQNFSSFTMNLSQFFAKSHKILHTNLGHAY
jgi:hypothetical protein